MGGPGGVALPLVIMGEAVTWRGLAGGVLA